MKKILITSFVLLLCSVECFGYDVIYNTKTNKFHDVDCHLTKNCTNCILIDIDNAIENNADPCSVCRSHSENSSDYARHKKKKLQEQKEREAKSPGIKKGGNFTYTIK